MIQQPSAQLTFTFTPTLAITESQPTPEHEASSLYKDLKAIVAKLSLQLHQQNLIHQQSIE